jgi:hypothetical protein
MFLRGFLMIQRFLAAAALGLLMTSNAQAGLALDTVTGFSPTNISGPNSDGSNVAATSLSLTGAPDFNSISLLLSADTPSDGGSVQVYIVPNASGPVAFAGISSLTSGVLVGTIADSQLADSSGTPALVTLTDFTSPPISANGEYWIALNMTGSSAEWSYSNNGPADQFSYSDANGLYPDAGNGGAAPGAFAAIVDAPEPTAIALFGSGLVGLGYVRRRQIRSRS